MKLYNPKNGQSIDSPFANDTEARDALTAKIQQGAFARSGEFAKSIEQKAHGRYELSPAQQFWLHKLAMPDAPAPQPTERLDVSGLMRIFDKAKEHLKRPAIVLATPSAVEVKVSLAGERSRYNGSLMVASPVFGGAYYGRVTDGFFFQGRDSDESVTDLLHELATDPEGTAAKYGHLTGKCCFCNRSLADERSTAVGYGKTCAKNFGLSWGRKTVAQ